MQPPIGFCSCWYHQRKISVLQTPFRISILKICIALPLIVLIGSKRWCNSNTWQHIWFCYFGEQSSLGHFCSLFLSLASKVLPAVLKEVLSTSMKIVNLIRARALNHHIFKSCCQKMGAEYEVLLYHMVFWLSRGQILKGLVELSEVSLLFFKAGGGGQFHSEEFINGLVYLVDIFG